jgi:RloB-like protein
MGKKSKYVKPNDQTKPWAKRSSSKRREIIDRSIKNTFLICCEGENTEPIYFKSFPVTTETKVEAIGFGMSKTALVEKVLKLIEGKEQDQDQQIWVVFDRDVTYDNVQQDNQDFDNAIKLANKKNIKCAYSNDCFELWFVLHDEYLTSAMHRTQLYDKLSQKLQCNYETKGKKEDYSKSLYQKYLSKQKIAIQNAKRLYELHTGKKHHEQNPCTTVYELVRELNKNLRK